MQVTHSGLNLGYEGLFVHLTNHGYEKFGRLILEDGRTCRRDGTTTVRIETHYNFYSSTCIFMPSQNPCHLSLRDTGENQRFKSALCRRLDVCPGKKNVDCTSHLLKSFLCVLQLVVFTFQLRPKNSPN